MRDKRRPEKDSECLIGRTSRLECREPFSCYVHPKYAACESTRSMEVETYLYLCTAPHLTPAVSSRMVAAASAASTTPGEADKQQHHASGSRKNTFSAENFFATQEQPSILQETRKLAEKFVEKHNQAGRRVVLVTVSETSKALSLLILLA